MLSCRTRVEVRSNLITLDSVTASRSVLQRVVPVCDVLACPRYACPRNGSHLASFALS